MTQNTFENDVMELIGNTSEPFKPYGYYIPEGDCFEFFISDEEFYGKRIDQFVTIYLSMESHEIIGSLIKDIEILYSEVAKKFPGFGIMIQDGKVRLSHIFLAKILPENPNKTIIPTRVYKQLADIIEENDFDHVTIKACC